MTARVFNLIASKVNRLNGGNKISDLLNSEEYFRNSILTSWPGYAD